MKIQPTKKQQHLIMADLASIAKHALAIETLETRKSDCLDFHDCSVWQIRTALEAAYMAGRNDAMREASEENG